MGFCKWPFSWGTCKEAFAICYLTFLAMFLLHTLSHFRGSIPQGDGALVSLTHPTIQEKLINGFSPKQLTNIHLCFNFEQVPQEQKGAKVKRDKVLRFYYFFSHLLSGTKTI